jgi:hypothetical protein
MIFSLLESFQGDLSTVSSITAQNTLGNLCCHALILALPGFYCRHHIGC